MTVQAWERVKDVLHGASEPRAVFRGQLQILHIP